ncbi:MAG: hypothetical protein WCG29_08945 [Desulfomonile sp.]
MGFQDTDESLASYGEILNLLDSHGLLSERIPYTPALLEEAVFFAYKMRVINQGAIRKYLNLDRDGLRILMHKWNDGSEGNCSCRMAVNPFAEES